MKQIHSLRNNLILMLLLAISTIVNAQLLGGRRLTDEDNGPKGQIMIYGSLNYSKTKGSKGSNIFSGTSSNAGIPIGIGYFFNNNDAIGINYGFANRRINEKRIFDQSEAGIWYSPSVTLGKYFALIAQFDVHYVWGHQATNLSSLDQKQENFKGYRLRAYPLFALFLGSGWALKFKFSELSALQIKTKSGGKTYTQIAGIGGSTFGIGVSKNLNFLK